MMECCQTIELTSKYHNAEQLKVLGKYILKPTEYVENHPVYKHEYRDEHIAFSEDYGWTVYPTTPDDNDPPLVSFEDCKPPNMSDCPVSCKNNGQWSYFYTDTVTDTEQSLQLTCVGTKQGFNSTWIVILLILWTILVLAAVILAKHRKVIEHSISKFTHIITFVTSLTVYISTNQDMSTVKNAGETDVKHHLDIEKSFNDNDKEIRKTLTKIDKLNTTSENTTELLEEITPRKRKPGKNEWNRLMQSV